MPTGARLNGAEAMKSKLGKLKAKGMDEVGRALFIEIDGVETPEVKRRTPVDKGILRGTIHTVGPVRDWRTIYCLIAAGGLSAPYAIYVHENLDAIHKVGQAKYIESVIMESRPFIGARVAHRVELNRVIS